MKDLRLKNDMSNRLTYLFNEKRTKYKSLKRYLKTKHLMMK